ncbi:MAG: hypothetical protein AB1554_15060 [Chloroflexota bacterium]
MLRRLFILLFVSLLALALPAVALAQDYYFSLDKEVVDVYWNSDGTMALDYLFTFTNQPSGHAIEFVDVGMPNGNFDFDSIRADFNGNPLSISSDFQGSGGYGFAVEMGAYAIPPGATGSVHVYVGRIKRVLYPDDDDEAYTSAVFAPAYFVSSIVTGSTDLTVTFHLPPGVKPEEPRWHSAPSGFPSEPQTGFDADGRITYTWQNPTASASRLYKFGASFPRTYVPAETIYTPPPEPLFDFDAIFESLFNVVCFGTVCLFMLSPILGIIQSQRRKLKYLPPKISIEGHGIKRGLTAVEAAILMEQPLDKVMTMILFGIVKKGAATVTKRDPLEVQAAVPLPEGVHAYEKQFLEAFKHIPGPKRQKALQDTIIALVRAVSDKMKGFSRKETIDFYKGIMERAWQQVEAADTPEVKSQKFDEALEWTMLDRDYDDRTRRVFTGPVFLPTWWGRYDPTWSPRPASTSGPAAPPVPSQSPRALPGADFAASVVTGVQTFSQKVLGDVSAFTSRVTGVTNPMPKTSSGSGRSFRSGGGRSGGCACACACACAGCACACAGGGR